MIDLYFLIPAVIAHIFNSISELVIPIGIPIKEVKAEIEMHPVIVEVKIRSYSIKFRFVQTFFDFYSFVHFALFLQVINSFFHLLFNNLVS